MVKVSLINQYAGYENTLIPYFFAEQAGGIEFVEESKADIIIIGPHSRSRPFLRLFGAKPHLAVKLKNEQAIKLFHTGENVRWNAINADFSISFDHDVPSEAHLRFPLWKEILDYSHEGVITVKNPRFSRPILGSALLAPLGTSVLSRPKQVAFFSSHLRPPRRRLLTLVESALDMSCFGRAFKINKRLVSAIPDPPKDSLLQNYQFSLCPENGIFPGYVTEKIVEAYACGCIPITYVHPDVSRDFNTGAFINLADGDSVLTIEKFRKTLSKEHLLNIVQTPLLESVPTVEPLRNFIKKIINYSK